MARRRAVAIVAAGILALAVPAGAFLSAAPEAGVEPARQDFESVRDIPAGFDPDLDLQLPELPTGCEATALSTLLRLNGVHASKEDVADEMPKSDADFVHSFLGDPYSTDGGCCMSPCVAETASKFLVGLSLLSHQTEGRDLADLPKPCVVWVTIDLADPQGPIREQGAYRMYYPSHCVVVTGVSDRAVETIDPLRGRVEYPIERFSEVYETLGAQAVYIAKE